MTGKKTGGKTVIARLAESYPLLYLDPDRDDQEIYRAVVLRGEDPPRKSLAHFQGDPADLDQIIETPAGEVRVVTLHFRADYEKVVRGMMAAKKGPLAQVPPTEGASTLSVFNWGKIYAHQAQFLKEQAEAGVTDPDWGAEFSRFISDKSNYLDLLIVLSYGPYSHLSAVEAGYPEAEWLLLSDTIRKYHELNHVICRRLFPDQIDAVWDELVADAVGLYAAFGCFEPELEKKFLGIRGDTYTGGRLENYTDRSAELAPAVCSILNRMEEIIRSHSGAKPFDLIPFLEAEQHFLAPLLHR